MNKEFRLKCVELAINLFGRDFSSEQIVEAAQRFYDFATGSSSAQTSVDASDDEIPF